MRENSRILRKGVEIIESTGNLMYAKGAVLLADVEEI